MILACYFAVLSCFMKDKICSKCNVTFSCGSPEPGCWCESIHLTHETLQLLKEKYDNCLCPECLKSFEQTDLAAPNASIPC
jgi:Cysteine-rich CWC